MKNFSTVNTKISSIKSKLLNDEDFLHLLKCKSIQEVCDYLNENTLYNEVLWDLKGKSIHRIEFERRLYQFRNIIFEKLMPYLEGEYRNFFKDYLKRYEIEDIKVVLKAVQGNIQLDNVENYLYSSPKYTKIDFKSLLKEKTIEDLADKLKGSIYYRLLLPFVEQIDDKFNFYVEMVLDKYYYHTLVKSAQNLPDRNFEEIVRQNIDLYNLEWIYRAHKYFDMSKEEILNFSLDYGYIYGHGELKKIIYNFNLANIKEDFKNSPYAFIFDHTWDIDLFMERRINRYVYYKALKLYKTSMLKFSKVVGFIYYLEFQIRDIVSVIESKRYKMGVKETARYLIRSLEEVI